jgi:hypothetical protein
MCYLNIQVYNVKLTYTFMIIIHFLNTSVITAFLNSINYEER